MRRPLLAIAFFSGVSCVSPRAAEVAPTPVATPAPAPAPAAPRPPVDPIADVRARVEELLRRQAELLWRGWTTGEAVDFGVTYVGAEGLFSKDTIARVREVKSKDPERARATRLLLGFLGGEAIGQATAKVSEEADAVRRDARIDLGKGQTRPWAELDAVLATQASAVERARTAAAEGPVLDALLPLLERRAAALDDAARAAGWANRLALALDAHGLDAEKLRRLAENVLAGTDGPWGMTADPLARERLGLPLAKLRRSDLPRLLRAPSTETWFPAESALRTAQSVIGVSVGPSLRVDVSELTTRDPRPLCVPIDPPSDVRVSARPRAGFGPLRSFVHELGRCAAASRSSGESWELRRLDRVAEETAAAAAELALGDAATLTKLVPALPAAERARLVAWEGVRQLYAVRLDAARTLFALDWLGGTLPTAPADHWGMLASRALGFELNAEERRRWLLEQDDLLASGLALTAKSEAAGGSLAALLGNRANGR